MQYGAPARRGAYRWCAAGYHCDPKQPLPFAGLASQKNHLSLYIMGCYGEYEATFRAAWAKSGKKLDMGKCCVRFRRAEDLALDVIAATIKRFPVKAYVGQYLAYREQAKAAKGKRPASAKKTAAKKSADATKPAPAKAVKKSAKKAAKKAGR